MQTLEKVMPCQVQRNIVIWVNTSAIILFVVKEDFQKDRCQKHC